MGVDASPDMLAVAARRCAGHANVEFREGEATALPVEASDFDAALCVQVLEYVADPTTALAQMHRALRPGGRAVVWDIDWATVSWHSADPDRMARVLRAWDDHLTHPSLPRTLSAATAGRGLLAGRRRGARVRDDRARPRGVRHRRSCSRLIEEYAAGRPAVGAEDGRGMGRRAARAGRTRRAVLRVHPVLLHRGPRALARGRGLTRWSASSSCRARSGRSRPAPGRRSAPRGR